MKKKSILYYKTMGTDQIMYCIVALILGMLMANMLKNVCGCKVVEGAGTQDSDKIGPTGDPGIAPCAPPFTETGCNKNPYPNRIYDNCSGALSEVCPKSESYTNTYNGQTTENPAESCMLCSTDYQAGISEPISGSSYSPSKVSRGKIQTKKGECQSVAVRKYCADQQQDLQAGTYSGEG